MQSALHLPPLGRKISCLFTRPQQPIPPVRAHSVEHSSRTYLPEQSCLRPPRCGPGLAGSCMHAQVESHRSDLTVSSKCTHIIQTSRISIIPLTCREARGNGPQCQVSWQRKCNVQVQGGDHRHAPGPRILIQGIGHTCDRALSSRGLQITVPESSLLQQVLQ
jgi:hypothetical protein